MTAAFLAATLVEPLAPGHYRSRYEAAWYQGRGAYGGVVAGQVMRALEHHLGDARRPVRSLTVHFCSPAAEGVADVHTRIERAGKLVTHATARVESAGVVVAVATATFGAARGGAPGYLDFVMPEVPAPETLTPVDADAPMPDFCRFFEYRYCVGSPPYSGAAVAEVGGWLRPRDATVLDAALCVGLMDAYPPSVLSRMDGFRAAATVDFTVQFFQTFPLAGSALDMHYLRTGRSRQAAEGYTEESQLLWTRDGTLLAQCRQLIAVLG
ncbi:thioesterase family protein [Corallococcus sp. CA053C]|uniref:acyl-CoA thioesterase n=1 Tax=Corallococcus sp. CA053C TaxID=2316732 RepID=UPI000EA0C145|nr:thioesterase family protein [Corallococcus sp. CA053C]RKG94518.1 thioesterase family protein [Corallococcus sp. CA053C]